MRVDVIERVLVLDKIHGCGYAAISIMHSQNVRSPEMIDLSLFSWDCNAMVYVTFGISFAKINAANHCWKDWGGRCNKHDWTTKILSYSSYLTH